MKKRKTENLVLREYNQEDKEIQQKQLHQICDLMNEYTLDAYDYYRRIGFKEDLCLCSENYIRNHKKIVTVETKGGNVVGFIFYQCDGNTVNITNIHINKSFRKCGLGRRLVGYVMEKYPNKQFVAVYVINENKNAMNFWKSIGFNTPIYTNFLCCYH